MRPTTRDDRAGETPRPVAGHGPETERLERELRAAHSRERAAREEIQMLQRRLAWLQRSSKAFASSMREGAAERRRSRRRISAQHAVGRVLAEAESVEEAAPDLLRVLVGDLGWDLGLYWSIEGDELRRVALWTAEDEVGRRFEGACRGISFRRGEGLPGRAWSTGAPVCIEDLSAQEGARRPAVEAGLKSVLAFPVRDGGRTAGVFELFGKEAVPPDEEMMRVASAIGGQIGHFAERRRAEEALRKNESRYRTLANNLPGAVFRADVEDGQPSMRFVSERIEEITGYPADDFVADRVRNFGDIVHPEDRPKNDRAVWHALEAREPYSIEYRIVHADGGVRWMNERGSGIYAEDGSLLAVDGAIFDVTERRRAEEARSYLATLVESTSDAVVGLDGDFNVASWNRGARNIMGYEAGEIVGRPMLDLVPPEHHERARANSERLRGGEELHDYVARLVTKGGGSVYVSLSISPVRGGADIPGFVWMMQDITERKQHEERQRYLLELGDALRPLSGAVEIQRTATRILGEYLQVDRAFYVGVEDDEEHRVVVDGYVRKGATRLAGRGRIDDFGWAGEELLSGRTMSVEDVNTDVNLGQPARESLLAVDALAALAVPLIKEGRWAATFALHHLSPRRWTAEETLLAQETAERTWAAVERAHAEEALRASEGRLQALVENLPGGAVFVVDRDLRYLLAEGEALRAAGMGPQDLVGKTVSEAIDPELAAHIEPLYRRALDGESFGSEHEEHGLNFLSRGVPLRDAGGEVYAALAVSHDVTERKRAEETLRESEERFRAVANLVPDLLWRNDPSGNAEWYNRRWLEYTGQTLEEAAGHGWLDVIHPDDREGSRTRFQRAVNRGEPLYREHRIRRNDGAYRWFLVRAEPVRDGEGNILRWFGAATDVHEQRAALEALRENQEWLSLAQRAARSGTWEWDLRSGEIQWSTEHRRLFGFDISDEPIQREEWFGVVHPDDLPRIEEAGRRCFEEDAEWPEIEYRIRRPDGGERWIYAGGRTVRDDGGRPVRILGISTDVTARKRAEEERDRLLAQEWVAGAEAAERERISRELHDRVAHSMGVAHQSLQLHEVLKGKDAGRAAEKLELAREMTKASLELTRNLSAELRQLDAEEGLESELRHLLEVAVPPHIRAELSATGDESVVPGHVRGQLYLILREAVRNAVAHARCSFIVVGLEMGPGEAVGRVEDDGRGFDTTNGSVGVGLRSMRERAALLEGSLELACQPGKGTVVEVSVPLEGGR